MSEPTTSADRRLPSFGERVDDTLVLLWRKFGFWIIFAGVILCLLFIYFLPRFLVTIQAGHEGVLFRRFLGGTDVDKRYGEGTHLIAPWDTLTIYDVRVHHKPVSFTVLSADGLQVELRVSVSYHPHVSELGLLHKRVGPDYFEKIIKPAVISRMRAVAGTSTAEQLYTTKREAIQQLLETSMRQLNDSYIVLDNLLLEEVKLPKSVSTAIEDKAQAQQRVITEQLEARRKRIEADGIREFQEVVSRGLNENLLRWRGIEATLSLAKSENAKVVVIGSGRDGLPLILDMAGGAGGTANAEPVKSARAGATSGSSSSSDGRTVAASAVAPQPAGGKASEASSPAGAALPAKAADCGGTSAADATDSSSRSSCQ
jgi:regulator of protease activity HflC (stomatin/prohibitin superfamily)